jgi:DNA-binding transcriptional ArsR family regulator
MAVKTVENMEARLLNAAFRALAEPMRRRILELIHESPGMTIQELVEHFPVSRFAIMKHLNVLEAAWLVRREREGAAKRLYLDTGPLEGIPAWISTLKKRGG